MISRQRALFPYCPHYREKFSHRRSFWEYFGFCWQYFRVQEGNYYSIRAYQPSPWCILHSAFSTIRRSLLQLILWYCFGRRLSVRLRNDNSIHLFCHGLSISFRQREAAKRKALLENPIRLKQLQQMVRIKIFILTSFLALFKGLWTCNVTPAYLM